MSRKTSRRVLFGARLPIRPSDPRDVRETHARDWLSRSLNRRSVVVFVGGGCSAALGYPIWTDFARTAARRAADHVAKKGDAAETERFRRFERKLSAPTPASATELMHVVGRCVEALQHAEGEYARLVDDLFGRPGRQSDAASDPFAALVRLEKVSRFVTTNYDCEIEHALQRGRGVPLAEFGIGVPPAGPSRGVRPRSFTQRREFCDQLAVFALARPHERKAMVFHCHGRFDDASSIVATERDYQQWYMTGDDSEEATAFRRTLELLLGSNPILFVGYSLRDEDLLRPLRLHQAMTHDARSARPLFAILDESEPGADADHHDHLLERYGLHVLPYSRSGASSPAERGRALVAAIDRVAADYETWRAGWIEKPAIRKVVVTTRPPEPFRHYAFERPGPDALGGVRVRGKVEEIAKAALGDVRVIGITGHGGTGKSWHALELLDRLRSENDRFDGFVFWSSYYANDPLTGRDRIVAYCDADGDRRTPRLDRLKEIVRTRRVLIVMDGFERLLKETGTPGVGRAHGVGARAMLEMFSDPKSEVRSTLVFTSRLWPRELDAAAADGRARRYEVERLRTEDLVGVGAYRSHGRASLSALCALLDGHAYALALAAAHLEATTGDPDAAMRTLQSRLASSQPELRLSRMIRESTERVDAATGGLAGRILERVAIFMSPVTDLTLDVCVEAARDPAPGAAATPRAEADAIDALLRSRLMFRVRSPNEEGDPPGFVVHPTVRSNVFEYRHAAGRDVLPNFTLVGYTSGTAALHPGSPRAVDLIERLFDRLAERFESSRVEGRGRDAVQLCRSMFGLVRSRMEANTAPRWCRYGDYIRYAMRVANAAKQVAPDVWSYRERHEIDEVESPSGPLYADEIAWLYNDLGLALCGEGDMLDTYAVWELGYQMNLLIEGDTPVPQRTVQSQLHLGHTFLELGELQVAMDYLDLTDATNDRLQDADYAARIRGYRGLVQHLRGELRESMDNYTKSIDTLHGGGNARAESFFRMHRAALETRNGDFDAADADLRDARALAEHADQPDLAARAILTEGTVLRARGKFDLAAPKFAEALRRARSMGIRRLEVDVLSEQSRLALILGDGAIAVQRAMDSLRLANELALGLRVTHSLVILGRATLKTGPKALGIAYLRHAARLGRSQRYMLRAHEAEDCLQSLGEPRDSETA